MIHHIENERVLAEVLNNEKLVIIDFFAEWCGPCQMLTPILQEIDKEYGDIVEIYKVNVDESADCAMRYGVTAMPTLVFFKDGEEVERVVGFMPKEELEKIIKEF
ncbi:MAG: thioredoxin [Clostridia bacterium]|nr:thioredoxin [Clostridia bacterium]